MDNLIRVYDNVVDDDYCDYLVERFENTPEQWDVQSSSSYDFTQIDMGKHKKSWQKEFGELFNHLFNCVGKYKEDIKPMWPDKHGFESPKIKKYLPNGTDEFRRHVDVNSYDLAKRFLVFFLYLVDLEEGGETVVMPKGCEPFVSPCKKGSVIAFPPMWTHPHMGKAPINKPKYIVGSYLHYS